VQVTSLIRNALAYNRHSRGYDFASFTAKHGALSTIKNDGISLNALVFIVSIS
jgi:hypothetical protein